MYKIENLADLLKGRLDEDLEFVSYSAKSLTGPGENYGSVMLSVEIKCKNKKFDKEEIIYAVAKTPPQNEFMQQIFQTKVTFKAEIEFYKTIFPLMQELQKKHGMKPLEYHAKLLGERLNLQNTDVVDSNAVLLLENIAVKGFKCADRIKGFNFETIKLILQDLANFHATGIALKLQCPDDFNKKVKPFLNLMIYGETAGGEKDTFLEDTIRISKEAISENHELKKYVPAFLNIIEKKFDQTAKEPFATIVHQDLWVNNLMLKEENGKFIENKFVDFQVTRFLSPADDVLFILLTSIENDILIEKFDYLIQFYYEHFLAALKKLDVNTEPFSEEAFEQEIKNAYPRQLHHTVCMLYPIFMDKSKAMDLTEFDPETAPPMEASNAQKRNMTEVETATNDFLSWATSELLKQDLQQIEMEEDFAENRHRTKKKFLDEKAYDEQPQTLKDKI
ncbi:unnamed protein product [Brassicogethes aeneus]|uniref:CHK kinase-like domain-containing protein n=1 Tax=Brassicogethes aeneus TaxID=1431903 RepID=A0A9P0BJB9_BRAAE|nr:unnamed protein product [Brassicogethes aeneus]